MKLHFATEKIWQTRALSIAEVAKQHLLQKCKRTPKQAFKNWVKICCQFALFL
jgi:hypothetical protein